MRREEDERGSVDGASAEPEPNDCSTHFPASPRPENLMFNGGPGGKVNLRKFVEPCLLGATLQMRRGVPSAAVTVTSVWHDISAPMIVGQHS